MMNWIKVVLLGLPLCFCSCLTTSDIKSSLNTFALPRPTKPVRYSGVANMKLYSKPNCESSFLEKLPLNEKLLLLKTRLTWAFVEVTRTGATGWVEKAYLEKNPLAVKTGPKANIDRPQREAASKATEKRSEETTRKNVLDVLQPDGATAAPVEEPPPAKARKGADAFDAF
ncbi:MAG: hypothetical protein SWH78_13255 [Thermodesulfobacteriota bacterium]|nr:hypothetical protein [Thermodesulfobacteriota bacterium]